MLPLLTLPPRLRLLLLQLSPPFANGSYFVADIPAAAFLAGTAYPVSSPLYVSLRFCNMSLMRNSILIWRY